MGTDTTPGFGENHSVIKKVVVGTVLLTVCLGCSSPASLHFGAFGYDVEIKGTYAKPNSTKAPTTTRLDAIDPHIKSTQPDDGGSRRVGD